MRYNYTYDNRDRLAEKKASGRTLLSFAYDLNGNLTRQTDVSGKTTEYRYDLIDRITEVWDNGRQAAGYEYNPDGSIRALHCGSLYTEYSYDTDRNLTGLKTMLGNEILADNHYHYDGNGNRIEKHQMHGTTTYTYDAGNRLSVVEYPGRKEELFYDKAGNRTKRVCNGMEELYQYDRRNRLTAYTKGGVTTEFDYDRAGNLIKDNHAKYEYDAFNRTSKVETFDGNIQINRYDAEGLRHEMEENGKLVSFIFRGTEVVAEESRESRIRHIRTGELLASDAECARTYYHYASDELGSITHVVSGAEKDGEGAEASGGSILNQRILNRYEYDAWGNLTDCEETVENRFKYNGQQYDPITQQYYLRARYYNPVIGRFTQEDTYRNDGLNLYVYCRNNPIYYVDPSGNICDAAARRIMEQFGADGHCTASRNEQKKLAAYLRNKERQGGTLDNREQDILNQIDPSWVGGESRRETVNIDTGTANAFISQDSPIRHELKAYVQGKDMVMTETAVNEFRNIVNGAGGVLEQSRAERFLNRVTIIPDNPSVRAMELQVTKKVGANDKIIFGTGDNLNIVTMTSDAKFVRGASAQGVDFKVYVHQPIPLQRR